MMILSKQLSTLLTLSLFFTFSVTGFAGAENLIIAQMVVPEAPRLAWPFPEFEEWFPRLTRWMKMENLLNK